MEDTTTNQSPGIDPDVADVLLKNPEAAHFIASLAQGIPLAQAVTDHFGPLTQSQPEPQPEPEPAPEAPAETPMFSTTVYCPESDSDSPDGDDCLLLSLPTSSVWD